MKKSLFLVVFMALMSFSLPANASAFYASLDINWQLPGGIPEKFGYAFLNNEDSNTVLLSEGNADSAAAPVVNEDYFHIALEVEGYALADGSSSALSYAQTKSWRLLNVTGSGGSTAPLETLSIQSIITLTFIITAVEDANLDDYAFASYGFKIVDNTTGEVIALVEDSVTADDTKIGTDQITLTYDLAPFVLTDTVGDLSMYAWVTGSAEAKAFVTPDVQPAPEPGSMMLILMSGAAAKFMRRSRKKTAV